VISNTPNTHQQVMDQALALARNGLYTTMPNPRVGCVLVNKGLVVGQGWHERTGEAHAEIRALQDAGTKARGATAYVTLEPCSHMGRTPPCADALIKAGVVHVVVAMQDPNPKVAGAGIARLRAAGITVEVGIGAEEARELNIGFVSRMTRGQPWVRSKVAMSLDGRTALGNGVSQWITGTEARADGHHWRARSCAMLTGAGTVRQDDPALTVRHVKSSRQPLRIVVDNKCEAPLDAQVFADGNALLVTVSADAARIQEYEARGVEVLVTKPGKTGRVDFKALLQLLGARGLNEITVETGSRLNGALLEAGVIDEWVFYVAPTLLGEGAAGVVQGTPLITLAQRSDLTIMSVMSFGNDLRIVARSI